MLCIVRRGSETKGDLLHMCRIIEYGLVYLSAPIDLPPHACCGHTSRLLRTTVQIQPLNGGPRVPGIGGIGNDCSTRLRAEASLV